MIHFSYLVLLFSILFTSKISGLHLIKILSQDSIRSIIIQQENLKDDPDSPKVILTKVKFLNLPGESLTLDKEISETEKIELAYNQNDIRFEYVGLYSGEPKQYNYSYMLENYNDNWIDAGTQRNATYTNLDPGEYIFRVKVINSDGNGNESEVFIKVIIKPPWWATWWAYAMFCLIGCGLIFAVWRVDLNRRLKDLKLKESQLRAEASEAKSRIIQAENDRRTQELEQAHQLQLSMLPKQVPQLPGLDICAYMKTASEVGGDYYDFHLADDGTLTVAIGDATGHGLDAGMMVAGTKTLVQSLCATSDLNKIINLLNKNLSILKLQPMYMALRILRIRDYYVEAVGAGMFPFLFYEREARIIKEVESTGPPLGVFPQFNYTSYKFNISAGDVILLMTDGFTERFNEQKEMLGDDNAKNILMEVAGESANNIIERLVKECKLWGGDRPQDDDVTFVVIKMK